MVTDLAGVIDIVWAKAVIAMVLCGILGLMAGSGLYRLWKRIGDSSEGSLAGHTALPAGILFFVLTAAALMWSAWSLLGLEIPQAALRLGAVFLLLAALLAAVKLIELLLYEKILHGRHGVMLPQFLRTFIYWIAFLILAAVVLRLAYGIDLVPFVASTAALSFILGFALQNTLDNFFAGLAIHIEGVCRIGDWITVGDLEGEVRDMTWRTIHLRTVMNEYLVIPNSRLQAEAFTNHSLPSRVEARLVEVGVNYGVAPRRVHAELLAAARDTPSVLRRPTPIVFTVKYNDFSIDYQMRYWIDDFKLRYEIESEIMTKVWYRFKRAGIVIPFPIRDVRIKTTRRAEEDAARAAEDNEKISLLSSVPVLSTLDRDSIRELAESAESRIFTAGESVFSEGEDSRSLYVVRSGALLAEKGPPSSRNRIAEFGPGDFFGEFALLLGEKRSATVRAIEDSLLIEVRPDDLRPILEKHPSAAETLSEVLAERRAETENLIRSMASGPGEAGSKTRKRDIAGRILGRMKGFFGIK